MRLYLPTHIFRVSYLVLFTLIAAHSVAQSPRRPDLIGIATVELQVTDVTQASLFYEGILGYSYTRPANNKLLYNRLPVNQRQSILLQGGLSAGQIERLVAVGFQTSDAAAMRTWLLSKGIAVSDTLHKEGNEQLLFSVTDPDKHQVKFIQFLSARNKQAVQQPNATTKITTSTKALSDRILHVGLTISNSAAADAFYKDVLGCSEIWRGGATDSATSWINMRLPESTDYIEYMLTTGTPNRQQLGSSHHIALLVPDMQKAVDILRERSAQLNYPVAAPRIGRNNRWQLNLYDHDGTRIELMEPFPMRSY
jgi:catechol 2,3-dioxygenase-like lactoylglutathione lyase family enzyme